MLRHPSAAFKYVRDVLADPAAPLSPQQRDAFTAAVLAQAPQLLSLDAPAAAQVGRLAKGGLLGMPGWLPCMDCSWLRPLRDLAVFCGLCRLTIRGFPSSSAKIRPVALIIPPCT